MMHCTTTSHVWLWTGSGTSEGIPDHLPCQCHRYTAGEWYSLRAENARLTALLAERDVEIKGLVLTTRSDREYAEMKQRAEEAERQVARLVSERDVYRDSLLLISRGVWTARNSVESIVWSVREALKKGAVLAARGGAS